MGLLGALSACSAAIASAPSSSAEPTTTTAPASSGTGELYVAGAYGLLVNYSAGSAPGFTYSTDNNVYATDVTSTTDATSSTGGSRWWTIAALFRATGSQGISAVGQPAGAPLGSSTSYAVTVSPAPGNLLVVYSTSARSPLSGLSGGGVSTWHNAISQSQPGAASADIWWGQVGASGTVTLALGYATGPGAGTAWVQQYTAGSNVTWSLDTTGDNGYAAGAPSTIGFAPLTPSSGPTGVATTIPATSTSAPATAPTTSASVPPTTTASGPRRS